MEVRRHSSVRFDLHLQYEALTLASFHIEVLCTDRIFDIFQLDFELV